MTISSMGHTTELDSAIGTIIAAQALGYFKANTVLARLVSRDWENEFAVKGQTVQIPKRASLSANDKSEHTIITLQQPNDTSVSVTLNKHKEVSFLIEDYAAALARPEYLQGYIEDGMKVIAEQIDADIAALYSGLSQTIDATGVSGPLDLMDFINSRRLLNAAKAPLSDRFMILHEDAEADAWEIDEFANSNYRDSMWRTAGGALANAYARPFMGFEVFMCQKIAVSASVCKNLALQKSALTLATRPLPPAPNGAGVIQKVMDEDGLGLRVTLSYNADYLGMQCTIDVLYGVAEVMDTFGVVVSTDEDA